MVLIGTIVVGGGLSGLTRADALARAGEEVLLLEESARPGGVVRTLRSDGYLLELGPNTVRPTAPLWDLVVRLGLEKEALLADPRAPRYVDFGGRLQPIPMSPGALLSTRLLSAGGKLRLLREPFVRRGPGGSESVRSFFARRLGPQVAERFVEPFVSGIYAGDSARLSVAECFPRLEEWEREHGSLLLGALAGRKGAAPKAPVRGLLTFRRGLETLPNAMADRLKDLLRLGTRVESLARSADGWAVETTKERVFARRVVLAAPALEAARLVERFAPSASAALRTIPHPPLAVLHLAWPIDAFSSLPHGFGHLVVPQPARRILGAVYSSSLFPDRAPEGHFLATVFVGGTRDPDAASLSDSELASIAERDFRAVLSVSAAPEVVKITRYSRALPQYDLEHPARAQVLSETERAWPGLSFLGNYRGGVSVGDVVANAAVIGT